MESTEVQRLYSKNLNDLYEELGRSTLTPEYGRSVPSRQLAIQRGNLFVTSHTDKLKAKICAEWNYCERRNDYANIQALVYAVVPLISSAVGVPVATAMIVAVILIKIGLDELCQCPKT